MDHEKDFTGGVLKIALGIFLGGVFLWIGMTFVVRYQMQQAAHEANRALVQIGADAKMRAEKLRHQQQARREQEVERRRQVAMEKAQQEVAVTKRANKQTAAEHRKQAAWEHFFEPSPACLQAASVECGNAYMRARRVFERTYVDSGI